MRKRSYSAVWLMAALAAATGAGLASRVVLPSVAAAAASKEQDIATDGWNGERAMADIAAQLRFTPRSLDAPGHQQTIEFIEAELAKTPVKVALEQRFTYRGADGAEHALTNIVARLDPANPRRVIVATHYDSIVRAYRDTKNPDAPMPGANNSASGVAVLLETARALAALPAPPVGIDMIFFDGEEGPKSLGAGDPNWMALGSPYFVAHLGDFYPGRKPEKGVVFDMVCYRTLALHPELFSLYYAKAETAKFWGIGASLAPSVFLNDPTPYPVSDDQTALDRAGIPSLLVIDFQYEPWFNTTQDTLDKCSATSLAAVGKTLLRYLYAP
jgi:Zn-dependent M28 family amino/carboxypeptidase